jgi:ATP-dependent phosphofructokinase / diphosphate-dependent phosphofructokinase
VRSDLEGEEDSGEVVDAEAQSGDGAQGSPGAGGVRATGNGIDQQRAALLVCGASRRRAVEENMAQRVGILTSGGDCPGLNAAIRAVGKACQGRVGLTLVGFQNGFRGLVENRSIRLDDAALSGILTGGGTILGTSRDKPHRMSVRGKMRDMTDVIVRNYRRHRLDALICIGGGGTQKNALHLKKAGLSILTLPKTIDNDIALTDISIGFNTATTIASEAIDRLHSTATSHNRVIVVEVMGHRAGWLALEAGAAGGADVILIPEIPYALERVAAAIRSRTRKGKHFSIVTVAEGAKSASDERQIERLVAQKERAASKRAQAEASRRLQEFHATHVSHTIGLTEQLERLTGLESRLTILGHLQRGGTPSAGDRVLALRLGTAAVDELRRGRSGVMLAVQGLAIRAVALEDVAGQKKLVPRDHPLIEAARAVGTSFGD